MTVEENKLIAEFMGDWEVATNTYIHYEDAEDSDFLDLEYECNWNCLMPVVEKIEQFDNGYTKVCITDESCQISTQKNTIDNPLYFEFEATSECKRKSTYQAVVEFIKWYNKK